jgi:hypothetical protein
MPPLDKRIFRFGGVAVASAAAGGTLEEAAAAPPCGDCGGGGTAAHHRLCVWRAAAIMDPNLLIAGKKVRKLCNGFVSKNKKLGMISQVRMNGNRPAQL